MKKSFWLVLVSVLFAVVGCQYDDADLQGKVKDMNDRLTALEQKVADLNTQVNGIQSAIQALQANLYVTNVVVTRDASGAPTKYEITFSDGSTITLLPGIQGEKGDKGDKGDQGPQGDKGDTGAQGDMPVVGVELVDGVYYWTVNGELLTDKDGNYVPVTGGLDGKDGVTPQFKIEDGSWWVSYDNGKTWDLVGLVSNSETSVVVTEYDEYVELDINGVKVSIPKEKAFTLVFEARNDLGVTEGVTVPFAYTIEGVAEGDETEVDVYGIIGNWKAEAVATDNTSGVINVTNVGGGTAKVFVYATNHKGKTDMVSLNFEAGVLDAAIEAQDVPGEGGTITLKVEYNMDHEVSVPAEAQSWIHVAPVTKATQTAEYVLTVDANTTAAPRSATIQIVNKQTNESIKDIEIYQEAGASSVEPAYENWLGKWESVGSDGTKMVFTITKKVAGESYYVSGFSDLIGPVEAGYDPKSGNLLLKFYQSSKTLNLSSGVFVLYISGLADTDYEGRTLVAKGDEDGVIASVKLTSEKTAVAPNYEYDYTYSDAGTVHHTVAWIGLFGNNLSTGGWTYFSDIDYLYFPANWTKTEDGIGGGDEDPGYAKWLGQWNASRQTRTYNPATQEWDYTGAVTTDTWTISEKVKGVSYEITGLSGRNVKVEATYNPDGSFSIPNGQTEIGSVTFQGDDYACSVSLQGAYLKPDGTSTRINGAFDICTATFTSDTEADLISSTINVSSLGGNLQLSALRLYATDPTDGKVYTFDSYNMTNLPNKLTKVGGGSTGGDKAAYESYLGSWSWYSAADDTNYLFTVEPYEVNASYLVDGFGLPIEATYNDGKLEFFGQYIGSSDTYDYYFMGVDQDDYLEEGEQDGTYRLATATISGNSLNIVGNEYTAIYGGTPWEEIIVQLGVFGDKVDGSGYYMFGGLPYVDLPATLKAEAGAPGANRAPAANLQQKRAYQVQMPKGVNALRSGKKNAPQVAAYSDTAVSVASEKTAARVGAPVSVK